MIVSLHWTRFRDINLSLQVVQPSYNFSAPIGHNDNEDCKTFSVSPHLNDSAAGCGSLIMPLSRLLRFCCSCWIRSSSSSTSALQSLTRGRTAAVNGMD